ncbi:MAG: hypothetical protein FWG36_02885 [Oscillospiraceae bacterium]|nr:hypothetical protein [Oscillospiraceae bacterium]
MKKQKKTIEMKVGGIKCDACDWKDTNVSINDYKNWLNKPCPKCGANLLTEADCRTTKFIFGFIKLMNKFLPAPKESDKIAEGIIKMNGTGAVDIEIKEIN